MVINANEKDQLFQRLKSILVQHSAGMTVVTDNQSNYYLDTTHIMKNKKPLFFGSVQVKKNYISFHLMAVYVNPLLLNSVSSDLKKRMQGKSCFNFTTIQNELFDELETLVAIGLDYYQSEGYVEKLN